MTAWEVYSKGDVPYGANVLAFEAAMVGDILFFRLLMLYKGVIDGSMKLKMPERSPEKLSALVDSCFARNPEERPSFQKIYDVLAEL